MNGAETAYLVNMAATIHETECNERPEVVVMSSEMFYKLAESSMILARRVDRKDRICPEARLMGMRVEESPVMRSGTIILGREYDLEKLKEMRGR